MCFAAQFYFKARSILRCFMECEVRKTFLAEFTDLLAMLNFIQEEAMKRQFKGEVVGKIVLAIEEALVNVIKHGYPDEKGMLEICCRTPSIPGIQIIIKDQGISFNPIEKRQQVAKRNKAFTFDDAPMGGYGIPIFMEVMDHVEYHRSDEGNHLSLIKYL